MVKKMLTKTGHRPVELAAGGGWAAIITPK
jgi:hypothetical protein